MTNMTLRATKNCRSWNRGLRVNLSMTIVKAAVEPALEGPGELGVVSVAGVEFEQLGVNEGREYNTAAIAPDCFELAVGSALIGVDPRPVPSGELFAAANGKDRPLNADAR